MTRRTRLFVLTLLVLAIGALPAGLTMRFAARAQAPASSRPPEIGSIYLGNSLALAAYAPRLLTANAHVAQFQYSPTGDRVAYTTSENVGSATTTSVAIVTTQSGDTRVVYRASADSEEGDAGSDGAVVSGLGGWSGDAAYVSFEASDMTLSQEAGHPVQTDQIGCEDMVRDRLIWAPFPADALTPLAPPSNATGQAPADAGPQEDQTTQAPGAGQVAGAEMLGATWGPRVNLLAFTIITGFAGAGSVSSICLFDPASDSTRVLARADGFQMCRGWLDSSHLVWGRGHSQYVLAIASGVSQPAPAALPALAATFEAPAPLNSVPAGRDIALVAGRTEQPVVNGARRYGSAVCVWVRRDGGLPKMSRVLLDVFPGEGPGSSDYGGSIAPQFAPNGGFDREGRYQVAYVAGGDLKVADLSTRPASLLERATAGETLPCPEERDLAEENAKQLGLAILMYTEDYDEHLPSGAAFASGVAPYLPPDFPVNLPGGAAFEYEPPEDLALADQPSPATEEIGAYDLPCARVTLYLDGHVKVEDKPGAGG